MLILLSASWRIIRNVRVSRKAHESGSLRDKEKAHAVYFPKVIRTETVQTKLDAILVSQPVEAQPERTDYPVAAGVMIIVSACLLIVVNLLNITTYPSIVLWRELPIWLGYITLDSLAVVGGLLALTRTRLLFTVFGASLLIPNSLSYTTFAVEALLLGENITLAIIPLIYLIFAPVALVLSILSLIFLAQSKSEFR
jgi:hypothetical protein